MAAREQLIESYTAHYRRVNGGGIPVLSHEMSGSMRLMYGPLLAVLPSGSRVLDLGCGTGLFLSWLAAQKNIVPMGLDSSPAQVEQARRSVPNVHIACSDGLSYLVEHPESFGAIYCFDVLEHLPSIDLCLEWISAAHNALRPDGFFLCRIPNGANLAACYSRYMDLTHERCFTSPSILQLLEAGGLQGCRVIPYRAAHMAGRFRLWLEATLHRLVFRICGHGQEAIFTNNIHAIGYKRHRHFDQGCMPSSSSSSLHSIK
jgi:2-polyprenyl-3-methyl-5-hydroxy-6-metoxy-1,4-benzoquinol methylase